MVMGDGTFYLQCHLFIVCSISTVCCMSSVWGCGNALLKPLAGRGDNSLAVGDGSWGFGGVWVVGWGVLGPPSYLFFQMAFAAVSILRVFQLLSSCQVALRKLGAAFIECRDPGLTLEVGGKSGAASKHFDTVAAAELLVAGNYKDKIYHCLLPHIGGLQLALGSPSETPRKPSLASNFYFFNLRQVQCEPSIFIARWINEFLLGTSSGFCERPLVNSLPAFSTLHLRSLRCSPVSTKIQVSCTRCPCLYREFNKLTEQMIKLRKGEEGGRKLLGDSM